MKTWKLFIVHYLLEPKFLFTELKTKNNIKRKPSFKRGFVFVFPALLFLIVLQYTVFSIVSKRTYIKTELRQQETELAGLDIRDTSLFNLFKERTWLESRLKVAVEDSISLSVNLKDSVMQLELKGVVLKNSKIIDFNADRYFSDLHPAVYHHLFGSVASGDNILSTIEKIPLVVKKAPKNSVESANQSYAVDSVKNEEVHWMLSLNNGIVLKIEGSQTGLMKNHSNNKFWRHLEMEQLKAGIRKTLRFKLPDYQPEITLVISETDARAIYRALPEKPSVCIRF